MTKPATCGACKYQVPYMQHGNGVKDSRLDGFLVCSIKQSTPEDRARLMCPGRPACEQAR